MHNRLSLLTGYRLFFALLGFSALVTEIAVLVERGVFNPLNFLSFFTVESNIIVTVVLLLSAVGLKVDTLRIAATIYILVVGIGFSLLLAGLENVELTAVPWDNTVLHYIIPIAMAVDLLVDRPVKRRSFTSSLPLLLFPVAYAAYSLIRGAITGWYPYPFLNPATAGVGMVVVTIGGIVMLALLLTWVVTRLSGTKRAKV